MKELFEMIYKRKSVRKFDDNLVVTEEELEEIRQQLPRLIPLQRDIKTAFKIVPKRETTCKRGQYCLLMYSEQKPGYLLNAGYLLEQMDLYLASKDIGVCWYGMGKPGEMQADGMEYVIMLAFGKSRPEDFRKDMFQAKRKGRDVIWKGIFDEDVVNLVRYAPSACNMQPWRVVSEDGTIRVFRTTLVRSIVPVKKRAFYNTIDMGIFLCFLEVVLEHHRYGFERTLDVQQGEGELIGIAAYRLI